MKIQDLTGRKFGKLTVLNYTHRINTVYYWRCRCECGKEIVVQRQNLFNGSSKSCGCIKGCKGKNSLRFSGCEEIPGSYICKKRFDAKRRCRDFLVSPKYLWELFLKQNRECALSHLPIAFAKFQGDYTATASLDRKDSCKGYVEGNVQWVHKDVNRMKSDFNQVRFIELCKMITECQNKASLPANA